MSADKELADAAADMIAAAADGKSVVASLRARCPHVYRQVARDAQFPGLLSLWGRCVNFDENTREVIVHPAILRALGELAGIAVRGTVVHAGLQHTYGYLFSLIQTPYGFKRDRWLSTGLERGLGVDHSLLGDRPAAGTLLANATWLLGQVAFRGRTDLLSRLARQTAAVAPALVDYNYDALSVHRLEERAALPGKAGSQVTLVTDLVTLPRAPAGDRLLIYSTQAGARAPLRLVTSFPMSPAAVQKLLASVQPGRTVAIQLRYNGYVRGLYGHEVPGKRQMVEGYTDVRIERPAGRGTQK